MRKPRQFWMVYGNGQGGPTVLHASREVASAEARRLAKKHAGTTFVVLEAVEAVTKREFDTVTFRAAPDLWPAPARVNDIIKSALRSDAEKRWL